MVTKRFDFWIIVTLGLVLILGAWQQWLPYSLTETLGFVTGLACVYLVVKQNIWNFPVGIANNIFFFILFISERLYGDAGLQVVYVALGLQGWYWWLYGGQNRTTLRIAHAKIQTLIALAGLVLISTLGLTQALQAAKGAVPLLDAFTTVLSLAAQYLLNHKYIESWYAWIFVDVLYIYLYISRELYLTAILYFAFLCLCFVGVLSWWQILSQQKGIELDYFKKEEQKEPEIDKGNPDQEVECD